MGFRGLRVLDACNNESSVLDCTYALGDRG